MNYYYDSPAGRLYVDINADGAVTGLKNSGEGSEKLPPGDARQWLDCYFSGKNPGKTAVLCDGDERNRRVWELISEIPYGETSTYGCLAEKYLLRWGERLSPRTVGMICGKNPVWLMVPCHRVIMADGSLGGYAGGPEMKRTLLRIEVSA